MTQTEQRLTWQERLSGVRTESARVPEGPSSQTVKGAPPTFVPDMILKEVWKRDNMKHVLQMSQQNPIAARIVHMVAKKAIDDWFIIRNLEGEEHPLNAEIQLEFIRLRAKHYVTMALAGERWGGHSWLQVIREKRTLTIDTEDSEQLPLRITGLDFWTRDVAKVWMYNTVNGAPEEIQIKYEVGVAAESTRTVEKILDAKDFILFRTRPFDRSHQGRGVLDSVWDYLVYLQYLFHAVTWYAMKVGLGWLFAKIRNLTDEKRSAMETNMKRMGTMRFLMFDTDVEDIGWIGAGGASINFSDYIDAILDEIAAGTDLPKVVITGQEQGSIAGGEGIEKALYSTIQGIQGEVDPYLREVIIKMDYDDSDMVLDWNTRYAHNEKDEAEIEASHVSAQVARLQYYKMNEVRAIDSLEPVEGGDKSPAEQEPVNFNINQGGPISPSEQDQTRNKPGKQIG